MTVIVNDKALEKSIRLDRQRSGTARFDEVWEGVYHVSPIANREHQWLITAMVGALLNVIDTSRGDRVYPGINVSDRKKGWKKNFRVPDIAVVLAENPCRWFDAVMVGGPDLVFEVVSRNDMAREKLAFYAKVRAREVVLIDRDPWSMELFRWTEGVLKPVGLATVEGSERLGSEVLPIIFRLAEGEERPTIKVFHAADGRAWNV